MVLLLPMWLTFLYRSKPLGLARVKVEVEVVAGDVVVVTFGVPSFCTAHARVHADDGRELRITCSIGLATHAGHTFDRAVQLVKAADQGVYAAKAAGRNCVRVWSSIQPWATHRPVTPGFTAA